MVYLMHQGVDPSMAFKITEIVRKGKATKLLTEEHLNTMREHGVPEWYIESCMKIKYMFPKAHAAAYVISALRIAWYKVHRPLEFYCAYFTARPEDVEVNVLMQGRGAVRNYMREIKAKGKEASAKETAVYNNLLIFNEIMRDVYKRFVPYDISFPQLKLRSMVSRWGSCLVDKGVITLNKRLIEAPKNCIEYVIYHEFCHFVHPNHSKQFYTLLQVMLPDWKKSKKLLEDTIGR
jgi:DNA polymerase III alpha subunit